MPEESKMVRSSRAGTTQPRQRLAMVVRRASEFVTVDDASLALKVDRVSAAQALARWHRQGWLRRVRRGLYAPVPLAALPGDQVLEDPWTLVSQLFEPGYVGAASAAQHWDLTEQLFRTLFVYTTRPVRQTKQTIHGVPFEDTPCRKGTAVRHAPDLARPGEGPSVRRASHDRRHA
jgi:predicted transcriptional regulator of viral defense system